MSNSLSHVKCSSPSKVQATITNWRSKFAAALKCGIVNKRIALAAWAATLVLGSNAAMASTLSLSDISVLLPLPTAEQEKEQLLAVSTLGKGGVLVPKEAIEQLPPLLFGEDRVKRLANVHALAIRIDPCFVDGPPDAPCRQQIRLVWQPVVDAASGAGPYKATTVDAAYHSFYDLEPHDFQLLIAELKAIVPKDAQQNGRPLEVHPQIAAQGLQGDHWRKLKGVILKYAGQANLSRLTVMTVSRSVVKDGRA
jgi:hypothetical protein